MMVFFKFTTGLDAFLIGRDHLIFHPLAEEPGRTPLSSLDGDTGRSNGVAHDGFVRSQLVLERFQGCRHSSCQGRSSRHLLVKRLQTLLK